MKCPKLKDALLRMGYRKLPDGVTYAKPVGYHLFVVKPDKKFYNYFIGVNKKLLLWSSGKLVSNDLRGVKTAEYSTNITAGLQRDDPPFDFLTKEQEIEEFL